MMSIVSAQIKRIYSFSVKEANQRLLLATVFFMFFLSITAMVRCAEKCIPTEPDMLGPFYKPDAPVRSSVGKGYLLSGAVRSAKDCTPLAGAKIEFWLAGPNGEYDDKYRATVFSDKAGGYRLESHFPPPYYGRPSHIHIKVSASGFKTLITQHYPSGGKTQGILDLVLLEQ